MSDTFTPPSISHLSAVAYLVGHPIAHSSSPTLHKSISSTTNFPYAQVLVESHDLPAFLAYLRNHPQSTRLIGSGVTMPHKVSVIPHLDHITPEGKAIGAINTIFFKSDPASTSGKLELWGTNTDTIGIRDAFLNNLPSSTISSYRGKPGLVVGGGGTCRAAIYALQHFLGCSSIYIINRDAAEVNAVLAECHARSAAEGLIHVSSLAQAQSLTPPALIVSAVPDFPPVTTEEKAVRDILSSFLERQQGAGADADESKGSLLEMCYHPSPNTQITELAQSKSWRVLGGIEAMIGQGLEQAKLWAGVTVNDQVRDEARVAVRPKT